MLTVISTHEMAITKAAQNRLWAAFLKGGTRHSGMASTLPYIIRRCEAENVRYELKAFPKKGYFIRPLKEGEW